MNYRVEPAEENGYFNIVRVSDNKVMCRVDNDMNHMRIVMSAFILADLETEKKLLGF